MYIGFYNFYNIYNKNKMFESPASTTGSDSMYSFYFLGQQFIKKGCRINTIDLEENLSKFDAIIFIDFPTFKNKYFSDLVKQGFSNLYLITMEPYMTRPDNWDKENHKYFKKIFTWNDKFIDNIKYFKINYSFLIPKEINFNVSKKEKLCTLIAGHKYRSSPIELYSERIKTIRWFEKNHPEDFDLYGLGWGRYQFKGIFWKLNKYEYLKSFFKIYYPSYKGAILSKKDILEKYKFSICYENEIDMPGYITEKIFDCFFAGNVPIYLGCPNIEEHIPIDTFIDKRNFKTYDDLYLFIKNMTDLQYERYLINIKSFLLSNKFYNFNVDSFAETILSEILIDIYK